MYLLGGFGGLQMPLFDGRPWTADEIGTLRMLAADGWDKVEIADVIKRTVQAVSSKATKHKIQFLRSEHPTRRFKPEEDETLREMAAEGYSPITIAAKLRRGIRGVHRRAQILNVMFAGIPLHRTRNPEYLGWNTERIELATARWKDGCSAASIANELGCGISKNAVIGKMYRIRSGKPRQEPRRRRNRTNRRRLAQLKRANLKKARMKLQKPGKLSSTLAGTSGWFMAPSELPTTPATDVARVKHNDLDVQHCRWPVGDPAQVLIHREPFYCGNDREPGLPYCREHCRRGFNVIPKCPHHVYPTPGIV